MSLSRAASGWAEWVATGQSTTSLGIGGDRVRGTGGEQGGAEAARMGICRASAQKRSGNSSKELRGALCHCVLCDWRHGMSPVK